MSLLIVDANARMHDTIRAVAQPSPGRCAEAHSDLDTVLRLRPEYAEARASRARLLIRLAGELYRRVMSTPMPRRPPPPAPDEVSDVARRLGRYRGRMAVLIVDDNARMRETIRVVVQTVDADVLQCADGASAVALYESVHPDWALMDLEMGGVDGVEATRRICASDPQARVVIVTDHDTEAFRDAARDAGACAFVPKSDLTKLLDVIERT